MSQPLWVDVTTLLGQRGAPTGIPRTLSQLLRHWLSGGRPVRLCAFDGVFGTCFEVSPHDPRLTAVLHPRPENQGREGGPAPPPPKAALLFPAVQMLKNAYRAGRRVGRRAARPVLHAIGRRRCGQMPFVPGDVLLLAGLSWNENPAALVSRLRQERGVRVAQMIYDIIPVRCPQWSSPDLAEFRRWLPVVLRQSDQVLTISEYSRRDILRFADEQGIPRPAVEVVRLGDEPGADTTATEPALPGWFRLPFALHVSTVSAHKNQRLLLEVWRRLVRDHGGRAPRLVLAGGKGWQGEQILHELARDAALGRHVVHLARAGDAQLRWLYRHCLFTLYPSHYEGWGLPVAESLAQGKVCIASSATSLPEVGGTLAEYHGPNDADGCRLLVERACFTPGWLQTREERIRREHRPTRWVECAAQTWRIVRE